MLKLIFITNWKTTVCGLLLLLVWITFLFGKISQETLLALALPILTTALAITKDGVRPDVPVAREDVPSTPTGPGLPPAA